MNCDDCTLKHNPAPVSYLVHESIMVRQERTIRRLWVLCIILIACLLGTNFAWIVYENSFDDISISQTADSGISGTATNGVNINGESNPDD